jgi:leader peptidase (prepilin peptidase)/N-methyltransferase
MGESAALLSSPLAVAAAAVFGALWGSFFNVCIARLPRGLSVVRPGSRCGSCGTAIRAADNLPVLSYFVRRGRCRACGARFSARYPLVEALGAALAACLWWRFVAADADGVVAIRLARFALYFAFAGALTVLSFIDIDTQLLPDVVTLPAIPALFAAAFGAHDVPWRDRLIGAVAGYLLLRLIADFYYYVLRREGMGLGDAKLLALIGAVLGWKALPLVVFAGALVGSLVTLPLLLRARRRAPAPSDQPLRHVQVPFGPFLALGALIHLFAGRAILDLLGAGVWSS